MLPGMRHRWPWLLAAAIAAIAPAQDDAAFVAAHAAALAAAPTEQATLAAIASDRFLSLPPGAVRDQHLAAGVQVAVLARRFALAAELAAAARARLGEQPQLVGWEVEALLQAGAFAAGVDCASAAPPAAAVAVRTVFERLEATLLPLAERALRAGDTRRGRFVFELLAASEPPRGYRLGNLALCLRQIGDLAAARAIYERARHVAPDDLELENDRGLFLRAVGEPIAAAQAFARAWAMDLARDEPLRGRGPAITNLMHLRLTRPQVLADDPLPDAAMALLLRPDAAMLKRLMLDAIADRLPPRPRR